MDNSRRHLLQLYVPYLTDRRELTPPLSDKSPAIRQPRFLLPTGMSQGHRIRQHFFLKIF
jgi:hypothetical protein